VDAQERYSRADEAYLKSFGSQSSELIGSNWKSIIPPEDIAGAIQAYQEMKESGFGEFELCSPSVGSTLVKRMLLVKDYDQEKAFSGHFCFLRGSHNPNRIGLGIREGEEIFHAALEYSPIGALLVDPISGFMRTNRVLSDMLGYIGPELLGRHLFDITAPGEFEEGPHLAYLVLKGVQAGYHLTRRILRKDGVLLWADISARVIRDTNGRVLYVIVLVQDLSGTAQAEESALRSGKDMGIQPLRRGPASTARNLSRPSPEALLKAFNLLPDFFTISTLPEHRYVSVSNGFLRLCDCRREEVIGRTPHELSTFLESQDRDQLISMMSSLRRGQQIEFNFRVRSGEERLGLLTTEIIEDDGQNYLLTLLHDITEQKRVEKLLHVSEERYYAVAEQGEEGILLVDPTSKQILEATRFFLQMVGYSRLEITRFTLYDLIALNSEVIDSDVSQALLAHIYSISEWPFRPKDGAVIDVEVNSNTVYYRGVLVLRLVVRDIRERRRLEEQLRHAVKMEALGLFAGGMAHDFNNLLVGVLGYSSLLENKLQWNEPLFKMAHEITTVALRARELTAQILSLSRRQVLPTDVLDLNVVVKAAEGLLRRIIGEDINLVCEPDSAVGSVRANPGQIDQVIINLAANSRDAMPTGGTFVIKTADVRVDYAFASRFPGLVVGNYVLLSIRDTGNGMDSVTLSHIFEPFYTTKDAGVGTGLGLSTVYGIIQQLGGYVSVDSQLGSGTTFNIYLPRVEEQASLFEPTETVPIPSPVSSTVLVVEDESTVRSLIGDVLRDRGYLVLSAENAEQALVLAHNQKGPIHLLVTDIILPTMLGTQLANELQTLIPDVKVLFISGYSDKEIVRRTQVGKSVPFIQKPFTPQEFCSKVREVLNAEGVPIRPGKSLGLHEIISGMGESCLLYTSPSPRDLSTSRMPSSA